MAVWIWYTLRIYTMMHQHDMAVFAEKLERLLRHLCVVGITDWSKTFRLPRNVSTRRFWYNTRIVAWLHFYPWLRQRTVMCLPASWYLIRQVFLFHTSLHSSPCPPVVPVPPSQPSKVISSSRHHVNTVSVMDDALVLLFLWWVPSSQMYDIYW
jgi:hypothetical protein